MEQDSYYLTDLRKPNFSEYCLVPVIYGEERFDATEYAQWLLQQQTLRRILISANAHTLYPLLQRIIPCPDLFISTIALIRKHKTTLQERFCSYMLILLLPA